MNTEGKSVSALGGYANVRNPSLGKKVTEISNQAMRRTLATVFASADSAAKAWSSVIQPIANRYDVEVASKIYAVTGSVDGPVRLGAPTSDGTICGASYQCGVDVRRAGAAAGILCGYIHSHPRNVGFSYRDLYAAVFMRNHSGNMNEFVAYVTLPNGVIYRWSTSSLRESPQADWDGYARNTVTRVK